MQPFSSHTGIAVPMIEDDINTDQMAPVQAMREIKPDYKKTPVHALARRGSGLRAEQAAVRATPASW